MKAIIITLAATFILFTSPLLAGNDYIHTPVAPAPIGYTHLAPVTPAEATFEDSILIPEDGILLPSIPSEAGFEELPAAVTLTPAIPAEADFE